MSVTQAVQLRRLFRVVNGGTPTSDEDNWGGGIQWATPVDLGRVHGRSLDGTDRTVTHAGLRTGSAAVPSGSLVVSTRAPIGYVAETTALTAFNQGCRGLVPTRVLDLRFYRYVIVGMAEQLQAAGQGSTFVELSGDALAQQRLPMPPLQTQRAIADFLDTEIARIDTLITKKRHLLSLLSERFRSLVSETVSVGRFMEVRRVIGMRTSGPRGWAERVGTEGAPFIRSQNLRREDIELNLTHVARVQPPENPEARRSRTSTGDVLIGITGANTGWVGIVREEAAEGYVSQHVAVLRPTGVIPGWLAYSLFAHQAQEQLLGGQYGGTKTQLGLDDLAELQINVPGRLEQEEGLARLSGARRVTQQAGQMLSRQMALLQEHRQALITAAVTGEL